MSLMMTFCSVSLCLARYTGPSECLDSSVSGLYIRCLEKGQSLNSSERHSPPVRSVSTVTLHVKEVSVMQSDKLMSLTWKNSTTLRNMSTLRLLLLPHLILFSAFLHVTICARVCMRKRAEKAVEKQARCCKCCRIKDRQIREGSLHSSPERHQAIDLHATCRCI